MEMRKALEKKIWKKWKKWVQDIVKIEKKDVIK